MELSFFTIFINIWSICNDQQKPKTVSTIVQQGFNGKARPCMAEGWRDGYRMRSWALPTCVTLVHSTGLPWNTLCAFSVCVQGAAEPHTLLHTHQQWILPEKLFRSECCLGSVCIAFKWSSAVKRWVSGVKFPPSLPWDLTFGGRAGINSHARTQNRTAVHARHSAKFPCEEAGVFGLAQG